jgi:APA family basic amino acid/polyamine antiporter
MTENRKDKKSRTVGLWISTSLVSGNMIGSGVFLLPSALALYGGISILGWLFSTLGALLLAFVFSSLSRRKPMIGGPYIYTREQFGMLPGFLIAWGYWISIWIGNAAIAIAAAGYIGSFFPLLGSHPFLSAMTAVLCIWIFTWINTFSIRSVGNVQLISTLIKVVPLLVLGTVGFLHFNPEYFSPFNLSGGSDLSAVQATAALTLWAFLGLESATIPADKVTHPEKTIPRATILGTLFAAILYISSTAAILGILSPSELAVSEAPFAEALSKIWGSWAGQATAIMAIIACLGALNGWILLQGQIPLAAARDNLLPGFFKRLSTKDMPVQGLVLSSILATILILMNYAQGLVGMFTFVIMLATLSSLFPYILSSLAQLVYVWRDRKKTSLKKMIKPFLIGAGATVFSIWAIGGLGLEILVWGLVLLVLGLPFYFYGRRRWKGENGI